MKKIILTSVLAGAAILALAGCSTTVSPDAHTGSPTKTSAAAPVYNTPKPTPTKTQTNFHFGETATADNNDFALTISKPGIYTPSQYADAGSLPANVDFTVTLKNTGTANFDPTDFTESISSGGQSGNEIFDVTNNVNGSPTTPILPGQSISWTIAFNVANSGDLTLAVTPNFEYQQEVWVG